MQIPNGRTQPRSILGYAFHCERAKGRVLVANLLLRIASGVPPPLDLIHILELENDDAIRWGSRRSPILNRAGRGGVMGRLSARAADGVAKQKPQPNTGLSFPHMKVHGRGVLKRI